MCWIKIRTTNAFRTNNECTVDLFDLPKQFRWAPDSRENFLAALHDLDICRIQVEEYHEPVFALSSRLFCLL